MLFVTIRVKACSGFSSTLCIAIGYRLSRFVVVVPAIFFGQKNCEILSFFIEKEMVDISGNIFLWLCS